MTREIGAIPSRDASNRLLAVLREGGWRPGAWLAFTVLATRRSIAQARRHPRAFWETTAVHGAAGLLAGRRGAVWVLTSWLMAVTHLGMIEDRRTLGVANLLTTVRGLLPALHHRIGSAVPVLALATDLADGRIARATGSVTRFGTQGDFLADTALWSWYIARYEPNRLIKVATACAWAAPVVGVAIASFGAGRMVDLPRSAWLRPAAMMEVVVGARAVLRQLGVLPRVR